MLSKETKGIIGIDIESFVRGVTGGSTEEGTDKKTKLPRPGSLMRAVFDSIVNSKEWCLKNNQPGLKIKQIISKVAQMKSPTGQKFGIKQTQKIRNYCVNMMARGLTKVRKFFDKLFICDANDTEDRESLNTVLLKDPKVASWINKNDTFGQ